MTGSALYISLSDVTDGEEDENEEENEGETRRYSSESATGVELQHILGSQNERLTFGSTEINNHSDKA
jgi:hypothetical protein